MPPTPRVSPTNNASVAQSANNRLNALMPNLAATDSPITVWSTNLIYELIAVAAGPSSIYSPAYYPSSGTWTCPPNVSTVQVECWGGGGGGGGGGTHPTQGGGGGGGGGEYAAEPNYPVVPGEQYSYTCGSAGIGGISGQPGTNGQQTVFDLQGIGLPGGITANGGQGGDQVSLGKGGAGGTGSSNNTHFDGGAGGTNLNGSGDDNPYASVLLASVEYWFKMDDDPAYYKTIQDSHSPPLTATTNHISATNAPTSSIPNTVVLGTPDPTHYAPVQVPTTGTVQGELFNAVTTWDWTAPSNSEIPSYRLNNPSISNNAGMTVSFWAYADANGNFSGNNTTAGTVVSTYDYSITTNSPGYAVFIDIGNRLNFKISRHNGSGYLTTKLQLSTPLITTGWNYCMCSYDASGSNHMYIWVYNSANPSGLSANTAGPSGTGNRFQVNSNSTWIGADPTTGGYLNGFSGYLSNIWMASAANTTSTLPNGIFTIPATALDGGCGGGASGGGGGTGGKGDSGASGNGGIPAVINTPYSNLTVGGTGTAGGLLDGDATGPVSIDAGIGGGAGGGGAGATSSSIPTVSSLQIIAAQSASYAGPDAVDNPSAMYTYSLSPLVTNPDEKQFTSNANLSPDCYQGGQQQLDSNYQGTMSSVTLLPNLANVITTLSGQEVTQLTISAEILSPNAASLILGYTNDTSLGTTFTSSSVTNVAYLPVPAGAQNTIVTWDVSTTGLGIAISGGTATCLILGPGNTVGDADYTNTATAQQFSVALIGAGGVAAGYLQDFTLNFKYSPNSPHPPTGANGEPGKVLITYVNPDGAPVASMQGTAFTDTTSRSQFAKGFTGEINAWEPGTATVSTDKLTVTPGTIETWHKPTLNNGWAHGSPNLQYKYLPGNKVHICGVLAAGSATSVNVFLLPTGYIPATQTISFPVAFGVSGVASNVFGRVAASTGQFSIVNFTSIAGSVFVDAIIPLDLP